MRGIIRRLNLTSEIHLTITEGKQLDVSNALDNTMLRVRDGLDNIIEGRLNAALQNRLIFVLIHSIKHPNDTRFPDLKLMVDPFLLTVVDYTEESQMLIPYIKIPLISALKLRIESIIESLSNKVFPNINWLEISELSVIASQYHTHKAVFNLVSSRDANSVTFKILVLNIQSTCNVAKPISDLTLVLRKEGDKIILSLNGPDRYNLLRRSSILGCIRNSVSKKLAEKRYIKSYKRFKQEVSETKGSINITWTFN